jgi:uncharacterized protein (TIGR02001 family)
MKTIISAVALLAGLLPATAFAQDEGAKSITITGTAAIASDYRFRGVSQSDEQMAVQGGLTLTHQSGLYAGVWASNLAGWGTFGGANMELDLIGGYKLPLSDKAALDVGLVWYMYPGGANESDFAEPYVKLTGTAGPATLTAGLPMRPSSMRSPMSRTRRTAAGRATTTSICGATARSRFPARRSSPRRISAGRTAIPASAPTAPASPRRAATGTGRSAWTLAGTT